jgi:hypothetical protein
MSHAADVAESTASPSILQRDPRSSRRESAAERLPRISGAVRLEHVDSRGLGMPGRDARSVPSFVPHLDFQITTGLTGLEPATSGVTDRHSNLLSYSPRAGDRTRTGDLLHGKQTLYQLSYARATTRSTCNAPTGNRTPITSLKGWRPSR